MKKIFTLLLLLSCFLNFGQTKSSYLQADYFFGNIIAHSPDATAFLQGHPTGFILSYNKRSFGEEKWQEHFNYPDFGYSLGFYDYHSKILGKLYAVYGHYNFYLLNRLHKNQLIVRAGIGLAYNTHPYNKVTNNKNTAFGSYLNSSTYFKLYYQHENVIKKIGFNTGLTFIHASNSNVKSPNSGANLLAFTIGLNYNLSPNQKSITLIPSTETKKFTEPIKLNIAVRGGINESEIIGSGQRSFFVASVYADKRINRISAIQFGLDFYSSPIVKDFYKINETISRTHLKEAHEFSRIGLFIGHELFINKISVETELGYYIKTPYVFQAVYYETLGLKRYLNKKWFASIRLKAHGANAETVEFGVGIRL
jgi:hypothetical protein